MSHLLPNAGSDGDGERTPANYDTMDTAVFKILKAQGLEHYSDLKAAIGSVKRADLLQQKEQIGRLREWTSTLTDRWLRHSYRGWLDWFDKGADEALRELATGAKRRSMDSYRADLRDKLAKADDIGLTLPKPPRA